MSMPNLADLDMSDAGELNEAFVPFPPGEYTFFMEASERKATKAMDGEYLNCTFVVAEGEYKDRKVFHMFNLWNKSQQTVEIAKAQWRAFCEACIGQPNAPGQDSTQLHFKTFIGTVDVRAAVMSDTNPTVVKYPAKNELVFKKGKIRSLQAHVGQAVPMAAPAAAPALAPVSNGVAGPVATAATPQAAPAPAAPGTGARPAWAR